MKTIIKDGKRNTGAFTFKCEKCGCKFKADVADYDFILFQQEDPHLLGGGWIAFPFPTYLTTNPKYDKINSVE